MSKGRSKAFQQHFLGTHFFNPVRYMKLLEIIPGEETLPEILERHGVNRIVVGHTPTFGVVWPEYEGLTVVVDTGISDYYGGNVAYLEITADARTAGYLDGKLPLPEGDASRVEYLEAVIALNPDNKRLLERLELLKNPPPVEAAPPADAEGEAAGEEPPEPLICDTS
mgnify:CR=1 FL=1